MIEKQQSDLTLQPTEVRWRDRWQWLVGRGASISREMRTRWWVQVLLIAVGAILYIEVAGLVGTKVLPPVVGWGESVPVPEDVADSIPGRFARWDSGWYLTIAENGYRPDSPEREFFPLYPLLTRAISRSLGVPMLWTGLLVSIAAFIGSGLLLYRWIRIDHEHDVALRAITWMYFSPMSFFFVAYYAEPLFLLLSIASVFLARRGRFVASGIAIALAGATRGPAVALGIPYVVEFVRQRVTTRDRCLGFAAGLLMAPLGFAAYMSFRGGKVGVTFGGWLVYFTWPWNLLSDGLKAAVLGIGITPDWLSRMNVWHDLLYAVVGLALSIWALKHLRLSAGAYALAGMAFPWTRHGPYGYAFWSVPRWVAVLFPLYLALGVAEDRWPLWLRKLARRVSIALLGGLSMWFASGRWVA